MAVRTFGEGFSLLEFVRWQAFTIFAGLYLGVQVSNSRELFFVLPCQPGIDG